VEHVVACAVEDFAARRIHARRRPSRASSLPPSKLGRDLDEPRLEGVLVGLLAFILRGAVNEYRPLFDKLTPEHQRTMDRLLGVEFAGELSRRRALFELPGVRTWFSLRVRAAHRPLDRSIDGLCAFPHVQDWVADELRHATKRELLEMKAERACETSVLTVRQNALEKERAECQERLAWSKEDEEAFEAVLEELWTRWPSASCGSQAHKCALLTEIGIKGHPSAPVKGFARALQKRVTVVPMDEYKTSKLCSLCHHSLEKARLLPTNDDGEFELRKNRNVLRCATSACRANFWNRDVNAARNILELLATRLMDLGRIAVFARG
jgi:hypothetical protein